MERKKIRPELVLFFVMIALAALGNGFGDNILANYYKEVYNITATQRGFIEFPREMPGLLCALVIAFLSFWGDLRLAFFAQVLAAFGLIVLGMYTPVFGVMLIFLFTYSMGVHLFMPLEASIGMSLAEPNMIGKRMGQYSGVKSAVGFFAAICVFLGFRFGLFSFATDLKIVFVIGAVAFTLSAIAAAALVSRVSPPKMPRKRLKMIFRKEYRYYYLLTVLHGVQKQIAYVYGSWVIIDILGKRADTTALLFITVSFISIFFMPMIGRWIDRFGIKKMMYLDALTFIFIYIIYGFAVLGITSEIIPYGMLASVIIYVLFVLDRLSMQIGMVKSVYLRSISRSDEEVTATLSTGISLDHVVSIVAAMLGGLVWSTFGSFWVFFIAAAFSLGNLYVAAKINPGLEREEALAYREAMKK